MGSQSPRNKQLLQQLVNPIIHWQRGTEGALAISLFAIVITGFSPGSRAADETAQQKILAAHAARAEQLGQAVFLQVSQKNRVNLKRFANEGPLRDALAQYQCPDYDYTAYLVETPDNPLVFYYIASNSKDMIIGKHMRANMAEVTEQTEGGTKDNNKGDHVDVSSITTSSNECVNLGEAEDDMYTATTNATPNEFHVLQSLLHRNTLFVSTRHGLWQVSKGQVSLP